MSKTDWLLAIMLTLQAVNTWLSRIINKNTNGK